jgi:hypothetical protein
VTNTARESTSDSRTILAVPYFAEVIQGWQHSKPKMRRSQFITSGSILCYVDTLDIDGQTSKGRPIRKSAQWIMGLAMNYILAHALSSGGKR